MKKRSLLNFNDVRFYMMFIAIFILTLFFCDINLSMAETREVIGYGELTTSWVNLGLNWEMTGGTSGRVVRGETFDVYERRLTDTGYKYYVYANNANIYGYISGRFMRFTPNSDYKEKQEGLIGKATLIANWVNLGINWEMTGGTSGRVVQGETFDVYDRKLMDTGYKYYVYAHNANIYGYISERFIQFIPNSNYEEKQEEPIGKATLIASWVNLGLNWEMTGGTSGRVVQGETFDVYDRKLMDTGYKYYVYAHNAGIYGYISERFIEYIPFSGNESIEITLSEDALFEEYIKYLDNSTFESVVNEYAQKGWEVLEDSDRDEGLSAYFTVLSNGVIDFTFREVCSYLGLTMSYEDNMRYEAIQQFMRELYGNNCIVYKSSEEIKNGLENANKAYEFEKKIMEETYTLVMDMFPEFSYSETRSIIDEGKKINVGNEVDNIILFFSLLQLYKTELTTIDQLMSMLDTESTLYNDLALLREKKTANPVKYLVEYYFNEGVLGDISSLLSQRGGSTVAGFISTIEFAELGMSILADVLYGGVSADEYIQATYLGTYMNVLRNEVDKMQMEMQIKKMQGEELIEQEICNYKFMFKSYLESVQVFLEHCKAFGKAEELQNCINSLETEYNYNNYISICIKNAQMAQ